MNFNKKHMKDITYMFRTGMGLFSLNRAILADLLIQDWYAMRETLEWYADKNNYKKPLPTAADVCGILSENPPEYVEKASPIENDTGARARETVKTKNGWTDGNEKQIEEE